MPQGLQVLLPLGKGSHQADSIVGIWMLGPFPVSLVEDWGG